MEARMTIGRRNFPWIVVGIGAVLCCGCTRTEFDEPGPTSIVDVVRDGGSDVFAVDFAQYQTPDVELPIGVFDSGIGGLTVLNAILTVDRFNNVTHEPGPDGQPDFENESFIYLGDQANMPYGNYPSEGKTDFLKELVLKDAVFLLGNRYWPSRSAENPRRDKPPIKAIVIACNTATSYGLEDIFGALEQWGIPIYTVGVVAAGADGAIESLGEMKTPGAVAVMATVGTCQSEGYVREIKRSSETAGMEAPEIIQQGSLGLASAIEGNPEYIVPAGSATFATYRGPAVGNPEAPIELSLIPEYAFEPDGLLGDSDDPATWRLNSVDNYIRYDTTTLVEHYRHSGSTEPISTVILGCTHFPFHQEEIEASFERLRELKTAEGETPYRNLIADEIVFIDPAEFTAVQLYEALSGRELLLDDEGVAPETADEFYISVTNPACPGIVLRPDGLTFTYEYKYGRSPGQLDLEYVKRVPMNSENLGASVMETIRTSMPAVWGRLTAFSAHSPRCADLPAEARVVSF
jgi:glutamate racemase